MVEQSTLNIKIEGSNPATDIGRENMGKDIVWTAEIAQLVQLM
jgi:hypothetical protein